MGDWRGVLKAQNAEIPFLFEVVESGGNIKIILKNAEERIPLDEITFRGDSIHVPMYIFDATIHAKISGDRMTGIYVKDYLDDYVMPFEAEFGNSERFTSIEPATGGQFSGKWEVDFVDEEGTEKAIGIFEQFEGKIKGTFVKSDGDYRFLEGTANGDTLKLSCFDGTHAYLFEAVVNDDGTLDGDYWSGKTWHQKWVARRNDNFELPDPYALTYMKEGYDKFEIKFPNSSGDLVELSDPRYQDKVVVIQLFGTWCPNCMDETKFYVEWLEKNKNRGVEIIGLAFERKPEAEYAFDRIGRMKEKLGVTYEILLAGTTSHESRAEALPMLNRIMSFPTTIILDGQHRVRKIHTGFSGPGTGEYYERFVEEFNMLMDKLLEENS
jgi:thiol-disulfide isomerase/thioredoxin